MANFSLSQLRGRSWLLAGPTNLGIVEGERGVYLIDSGNDKDAGRGVLKILRERAWTLRAIVNTHSHADHIGGNRHLQENTNCEIWATRGEAAFVETPELEPALLWGGLPYAEIRSKFFEAKASHVTSIVVAGERREGLAFVGLRGHGLDMVGVLSPDGVFYLGDGLLGERTLEKHKIPYIYDVQAYREGLARIRDTEAELFVPSHGDPVGEIAPLVELNLARVDEIAVVMLSLLAAEVSFEELLSALAKAFGLVLDGGAYVLVGHTLRSFLVWLRNEGRADYRIVENRMLWRAST